MIPKVLIMFDYESFYRLTTLDELLGNDTALHQLKNFATEIDSGRTKKPLLIYGPPGTGKSAAVHLLAEKHHWNVVEMGADDYRDAASIERNLVAASRSKSLFGNRNVIILDEIDELAAGFDKGAGSAIGTLIKERPDQHANQRSSHQ